MKFVFLFIAFLFLFPVPVFAYLDPGSGSILIYAVIAIFTAILYLAKSFFARIFYIVFSLKKKNIVAADIIFHSERSHYDHLFVPLLCALSNTGLVIRYITQYQRDKTMPSLPESIIHETVSSGAYGFAKLNNVEARVFVTTTPQLDVMMFKRSPKVRHYTHLFHGPQDVGVYKPFAFDYFDSLLCVGDFMHKSIRAIESARNSNAKQLFSVGLVYYDELVRRKKQNLSAPLSKQGNKKTVLIAPSWGKNGLFTVYGVDFLYALAGDYRVVVRPHPQIKISQPEIYTNILSACKSCSFLVDTSLSNEQALSEADIMISDFSGAMYDFYYLHERPVIIMDTQMDFEAFEGRLLQEPLWQHTTRKEIGTIINKESLSNMPTIITKLINKKNKRKSTMRERYVANFGNAAPAVAERILSIHKELS